MSPKDDYDDALALVCCATELCPRSAQPQKLNRVVRNLLAKAGMEDTAPQMRSKVYDLSSSLEYVEIVANVWRRMKERGVDRVAIESELRAAGINWQEQDATRLAMKFEPGRQGVRFEEMFLGCGIGDSFGAGVEFWDGRWIHQHVDGSQYVIRRGDPVVQFYYKGTDVPVDNSGAGQNYMPGMYTDDLEMTLGLAHALMQKENPTADDMLAFWKDEYFRGQEHYLHTRFWALAGIGRNGHGGIASVYSGSCTIENMRSRISGMRYPGNAPPMRALPLAFVADDARLTELARRNADATHPHIKARAASLGIAIVGRYVVIERGALDGLIPHLTRRLAELNEADPSKSMVDEETLTYLREVDELPGPGPLDSTYESFMSEATLVKLCGTQPIWRGPDGNPPDHNPRLVQILNADAQRTLGCVAYLLRHHREGQAMETVLRSLYIGGDVDSSAALCLAMVGGREGLRVGQPGGVPPFLLQHLEAAEYVAETAKAFEAWVAKM
eukprot:TRINITY_DN11825_c0_g1_i2.p1 TRINITY_DN11825_c0_g1~~TRINITY_DN11825_c0_g1_i2.p1  ORF type:complete len:515 (-),score=60.81 TRINITY_DN11825_c0_g1_i2:268-1767(-)